MNKKKSKLDDILNYIIDNDDIDGLTEFFCNQYRINTFKDAALLTANKKDKIKIIVYLLNIFKYSSYLINSVLISKDYKNLKYIINNVELRRDILVYIMTNEIQKLNNANINIINLIIKSRHIDCKEFEIINCILHASKIYDNVKVFKYFLPFIKNRRSIINQIDSIKFFHDSFITPKLMLYADIIINKRKYIKTNMVV